MNKEGRPGTKRGFDGRMVELVRKAEETVGGTTFIVEIYFGWRGR